MIEERKSARKEEDNAMRYVKIKLEDESYKMCDILHTLTDLLPHTTRTHSLTHTHTRMYDTLATVPDMSVNRCIFFFKRSFWVSSLFPAK